MRITELQNEANHLLFLYFTSVGVLQRDADCTDIGSRMSELCREIGECRRRICRHMECGREWVVLCSDYEHAIEEGREFVRDGVCFLDRVLGNKRGALPP